MKQMRKFLIVLSILVCSMGAVAQGEFVKGDTIEFNDGKPASGWFFFQSKLNSGSMISLEKSIKTGTSGHNLFVSFDKNLVKDDRFYAVLMVDSVATEDTIISVKVKVKLIYSSWKTFNKVKNQDEDYYANKVYSKDVENLTKEINTYAISIDKNNLIDIKDYKATYNGYVIREIRIVFPGEFFDYVLYYQMPDIYNPNKKSEEQLRWDKEEEGLELWEVRLLRRKRYEEEKKKREQEKNN